MSDLMYDDGIPRNPGLWVQLPVDVQNDIICRQQKFMAMSESEKIAWATNVIKRGIKLMDDCLTELVQDANTEYINSL